MLTEQPVILAVVSHSNRTELIFNNIVASDSNPSNPSSLLIASEAPQPVNVSECASPNTMRNANEDINIKPSVMMSPKMGAVGRRSFYDRTFTKLEKGSVRGSIFNLVSAALGGGVLSLSYVFVLSGYVTGLILITIGTIAGIWSNLLIAKLSIEHNLPNLDQIAGASGGNCLRKTLQIFMIVYAFGSCIGYQIFIAELIQYICTSFDMDEKFVESITFRCIINIPIAVIILFPLSNMRDMSSLRYAGVASVVALTYTMIVLIVECPFYYKEYESTSIVHVVKLDINFLSGLSITFFAFTCQMSLLPIYSELVAPNYRRIKKVIYRALGLAGFFYYLIASAGYFSTFNDTSPVVIERKALPSFDPDYFCLLAAVAICIVLFAAFPVNYNPCR